MDEDFTIDRSLQRACEDVVASLCGHIHPGDSRYLVLNILSHIPRGGAREEEWLTGTGRKCFI